MFDAKAGIGNCVAVAAVVLAAAGASSVSAATLDEIKERGDATPPAPRE